MHFLPTLGGQTGLNMAIELDESGILEEYGIEILRNKARSNSYKRKTVIYSVP